MVSYAFFLFICRDNDVVYVAKAGETVVESKGNSVYPKFGRVGDNLVNESIESQQLCRIKW